MLEGRNYALLVETFVLLESKVCQLTVHNIQIFENTISNSFDTNLLKKESKNFVSNTDEISNYLYIII